MFEKYFSIYGEPKTKIRVKTIWSDGGENNPLSLRTRGYYMEVRVVEIRDTYDIDSGNGYRALIYKSNKRSSNAEAIADSEVRDKAKEEAEFLAFELGYELNK